MATGVDSAAPQRSMFPPMLLGAGLNKLLPALKLRLQTGSPGGMYAILPAATLAARRATNTS